MRTRCERSRGRPHWLVGAILVAIVVAGACGGDDGSAFEEPAASPVSDVVVDEPTPTPAAGAPTYSQDEFCSRLVAIEVNLALTLGQPAAEQCRQGVDQAGLRDICDNPFSGVPPQFDEVGAQREFALVVAACPAATQQRFISVHPPESTYGALGPLIADMIEAAMAEAPSISRGDTALAERSLFFVPLEIATDPEFLSFDFPEPPQPDGAVLARVGRVDAFLAVSFSQFDPGPAHQCLAVALRPLGAYVKLKTDGSGQCAHVELDAGHPWRTFYGTPSTGELIECGGVRTVVTEFPVDLLTSTNDEVAARLGLEVADSESTASVSIGVHVTTPLLTADTAPFEDAPYFVPIQAEFPGPIDVETLEHIPLCS